MKRTAYDSNQLWSGAATSSFRGLLTRLRRNETGATAIELALVMPILVTLLTGIVQMGGIFFLHNNMISAAQDTGRRVVVGELTAADAQTYAESNLINWGMTYTVQVTEPGDDVVVDISVPLSQAVLVDFLGLFETGVLRAQVTARK